MSTEARYTDTLRVFVPAPSPATSGGVTLELTDDATWTTGQGSGLIDRTYRKDGTLIASGADTLNLLAAGSLTDIFKRAVDLDYVKAIKIQCVTGAISVTGAASNPLGLFTGSSEGFKLTAGQSVSFNLGAVGLAISTNGSITITETSTSAGATYKLLLCGEE